MTPILLLLALLAVLFSASNLVATQAEVVVQDPRFTRWNLQFTERVLENEMWVPEEAARAFAHMIAWKHKPEATNGKLSVTGISTRMSQIRQAYGPGTVATAAVLGVAAFDEKPIVHVSLLSPTDGRYRVRWDTTLSIASSTPWIRQASFSRGVRDNFAILVGLPSPTADVRVIVFSFLNGGFRPIADFTCDSLNIIDTNADTFLDIELFSVAGNSVLRYDVWNDQFISGPVLAQPVPESTLQHRK